HLQPIGMQTVPLMNAVESPIHVELSPSTSHDSGGLALPPTLHSGTWGKQATILLLGVLLVTSATIVRGIHVGEFSYNVDETQHAMTGVFVADLVRDHPVSHPVEYTYRYYAQYPALSGVIHWPPLFYCFEGLFFLALGPTV